MRYLYEKNAFLLPTDAFRSVCFARYLEFTHPLLPLLDKAQVVSFLDSESVANKRPMALLLFHAVMCAGVTFVDDEIIKREGFESKQSARRAFFNRAKVRIYLPITLWAPLKKLSRSFSTAMRSRTHLSPSRRRY